MLSLAPNIINPDINKLKKELDKGVIIVYDLSDFDYSKFKFILNTITSRGYEIEKLSNLIKE